MCNPLATLTTNVSGKWRFGVREPESLPALRKQALATACGEETDGSDRSWRDLPSWQRDLADPILSRLVEEQAEALAAGPSREVYSSGFKPNLLTDVGMDWVCGNATSIDFFNAAKLGTGTTPTVYDSEEITASASGTALTASSSFFTSGMVGMVIQWDGGAKAYIQSVTDGTNAVLATSVTASGAFAVHAVNRTGLANLVATQTEKYTDVITRSSGVSKRTMSWVFDIETVNRNYTEGGIFCNWDGSGYNTALSLFLLTGGTVTILIGQQATLGYEFSASVNTSVVTATWPMSEYDTTDPQGWDSTSGQHQVVSLRSLDGMAGSHGATLLPSTGSGDDCGVLTTTSSLLGYGDNSSADVPTAIGSYVGGSKAAYAAKSFYRDSTYTFGSTHSDTTAIRSFIIHEYYGKVAWQFLFDTAKGKTSKQSLSLTIRRALNRVLVNP